MNDTFCPDHLANDSFQAQAPVPPATTYHAPAGRDSEAGLLRKVAVIDHLPLLKDALDAMPNMVMILNSNRQIVAANRKLLSVLGTSFGATCRAKTGRGNSLHPLQGRA